LAISTFVEYVQNLELENPVIVSTDAVGLAREFLEALEDKGMTSGFVVVKQRCEAEAVDAIPSRG